MCEEIYFFFKKRINLDSSFMESALAKTNQ